MSQRCKKFYFLLLLQNFNVYQNFWEIKFTNLVVWSLEEVFVLLKLFIQEFRKLDSKIFELLKFVCKFDENIKV